MLFPNELWQGIADGSVTVAFRRWKRPTVKVGGTLVTPAGVIAIDSIDMVDSEDVTPAEALSAGFSSVDDLLSSVDHHPERDLVRIRFHFAGEDPRVSLRNDADLSSADTADIRTRLDRYDRTSPRGPWTHEVLRLIADEPGTRAPDLAAGMNRETKSFKTDVRKLKALGLTESLRIGYRLSPRGVAYLTTVVEGNEPPERGGSPIEQPDGV